MSRRFVIAAVSMMLLAGLVLTTGCAQIAEQVTKSAVEKATGVKVESDGVTVTGKNGEQVNIGGENSDLPDGFPSEAPVYAGAKITSSVSTSQGFLVGFTTADTPRTVLDWYKSELASKGWEVKSNMESDSGGLLTATMTGWSLSVNVGGDDSGGETTIVLSADKK